MTNKKVFIKIKHKCPYCNSAYEDKQRALECCTDVKEIEVFICAKCNQEHKNFEEANKCCA
jgi:hypothetical protein